MSAYQHHPDFPKIKDVIDRSLDLIAKDNHVFGWRCVSGGTDLDGKWSIKGFLVVTEHKETGVKGIIEFDRNGNGMRDSLLHVKEAL